MKKDDLLGTLVLVDPNYDDHPAGRHGDIGIVAYVDMPNDEIYLRFTDQSEAMYPSGALLLLKEKNKIFPDMLGGTGPLNLDNYKDLYKITTLQDMARSTDIWRALEIARDNPAIWPASLITVGEGLGIRQAQMVTR